MHVRLLSRHLVVFSALAVLSCESAISDPQTLEPGDPLASVSAASTTLKWNGNTLIATSGEGWRMKYVRNKVDATQLTVYRYQSGAWRYKAESTSRRAPVELLPASFRDCARTFGSGSTAMATSRA